MHCVWKGGHILDYNVQWVTNESSLCLKSIIKQCMRSQSWSSWSRYAGSRSVWLCLKEGSGLYALSSPALVPPTQCPQPVTQTSDRSQNINNYLHNTDTDFMTCIGWVLSVIQPTCMQKESTTYIFMFNQIKSVVKNNGIELHDFDMFTL